MVVLLFQIWVDVGVVDDPVKVYYDSDAMITKGITRVVCDCFQIFLLQKQKQYKKKTLKSWELKNCYPTKAKRTWQFGTIPKRLQHYELSTFSSTGNSVWHSSHRLKRKLWHNIDEHRQGESDRFHIFPTGLQVVLLIQ